MSERMRSDYVVVGICLLLTASAFAQSNRDLTGWTDLKNRLGPAFPDGAGILVVQVEATDTSGGYLPFLNPGAGEMDGKTAIDHTGNNKTSSHAYTVAYRWYGNTLGYAYGITNIDCYSALNYLGIVMQWSKQLTTPEEITLLNPGPNRVINNSWIVTSSGTSSMRAVRRADYQTDVYGLIYVNAVNNGNTTIPPVFASSYNGITVGRHDGGSSHGPTTFEGSRSKPDIVAPDVATSYGCAQVSGGVVMLIDQAQDMGSAAGQRPQVIKAILYAGAQKQTDWEKGDSSSADDPLRPLDTLYGAGLLRVDRNYDIMAAGLFSANGGARLPRRGWSYDAITAGESNDYLVHIATGDTTLSVGLAWHRHHTEDFVTDAMHPLNNIMLQVWATDASYQPVTLLQDSRSLTDNIQHVYLTGLARGTYLVRLVGLTANPPGPESYGLAWWSDGEIVLADMNGDGAVDFFDLDPFILALIDSAAYLQQYPGIEPVLWGDINGDGELDFFDIDPFMTCILNSGC